MARFFGEIPGVSPGTPFTSREALAEAAVHAPLQAGISGGQLEGADSIVVSGGYEDDEDYGDVIIYTGQGGNDPSTGSQVADQEFARGNRALAVSCTEGLPVRVVRGAGGDPAHSPPVGFRYDGLFNVEEWWQDQGRSGYAIYRYRLSRAPDAGPTNPPPGPPPDASTGAAYSTVQRLVRNTAVTQWVKDLHRHVCQVCGMSLATPGGPYAEGAHIRPRGRPHGGPDVAENVLCLCPNDHVLFDRGAIQIEDSLEIVDENARHLGRLHVVSGHSPSPEYLAYHRSLFRST